MDHNICSDTIGDQALIMKDIVEKIIIPPFIMYQSKQTHTWCKSPSGMKYLSLSATTIGSKYLVIDSARLGDKLVAHAN